MAITVTCDRCGQILWPRSIPRKLYIKAEGAHVPFDGEIIGREPYFVADLCGDCAAIIQYDATTFAKGQKTA